MDDRLNTVGGVRHLQENSHLGEFRVHASFAQLGVHLSPRTRGRIWPSTAGSTCWRSPGDPPREKREMSFRAEGRYRFWTADVRYLEDHSFGGDTVYVNSPVRSFSVVRLKVLPVSPR